MLYQVLVVVVVKKSIKVSENGEKVEAICAAQLSQSFLVMGSRYTESTAASAAFAATNSQSITV